jgi:phosphatidylserine decarboxylase
MKRPAPAPLVFMDRASGEMRCEPVYARGFLDWLYNSRSGSIISVLLTRSRHASRLYGRLQGLAWSRRRIGSFVERMGIDLTGCVQPLEGFGSFAEFFTRELQPWARPVAGGGGVLAAPADGRLLTYTDVASETEFPIKRGRFRLVDLLRDPDLAARFDGGSLAVVRLGLADYHHVHFPDSGVGSEPRSIPGRYDAGGPYARHRLVPFYGENHRMVTPFVSDHFGPMALVEVGAFTVGSIRQCFEPGRRVRKGERKAFFALGGSTVVLAFEPGAVRFDADLQRWSGRGVEVHVRAGERLGDTGPARACRGAAAAPPATLKGCDPRSRPSLRRARP